VAGCGLGFAASHEQQVRRIPNFAHTRGRLTAAVTAPPLISVIPPWVWPAPASPAAGRVYPDGRCLPTLAQ
jgi:hypothetical protein